VVVGDRSDLARRAQEDGHLVTERLCQPLLDSVGHPGEWLALDDEDDVPARTKGVHVPEAQLLKYLAKLGTANPSTAGQVDPAEKRDVLGHARLQSAVTNASVNR